MKKGGTSHTRAIRTNDRGELSERNGVDTPVRLEILDLYVVYIARHAVRCSVQVGGLELQLSRQTQGVLDRRRAKWRENLLATNTERTFLSQFFSPGLASMNFVGSPFRSFLGLFELTVQQKFECVLACSFGLHHEPHCLHLSTNTVPLW